MKKAKLLVGILFAVILSGTAYAQEMGKIYSTDILAYVGGNEVPSYNIGGRTVVVVEELDSGEYGRNFSHEYDDNTRTLTVRGETTYNSNTHVERGSVGKILGNVYDTDIKVIFNGSEVKGYNIGGKTAVCLEDLGELDESPNREYGYSKYAAKYEWNEKDRTISLNFAESMAEEQRLTFIAAQYNFTYNDNVLTAEYDNMNDFYGNVSQNTTVSEQYVIKPLYLELGGEREEIGIYYTGSYIDDTDRIHINITDMEAFKKKLYAYKEEHKLKLTYDEVLGKFNDGTAYKTLYKEEAGEYVMIIAKNLASDDDVLYIAAKKNGEFVVISHEGDYEETTLEKTGDNTITVSVYPFGGPHGPVTMSSEYHLDWYLRSDR